MALDFFSYMNATKVLEALDDGAIGFVLATSIDKAAQVHVVLHDALVLIAALALEWLVAALHAFNGALGASWVAAWQLPATLRAPWEAERSPLLRAFETTEEDRLSEARFPGLPCTSGRRNDTDSADLGACFLQTLRHSWSAAVALALLLLAQTANGVLGYGAYMRSTQKAVEADHRRDDRPASAPSSDRVQCLLHRSDWSGSEPDS